MLGGLPGQAGSPGTHDASMPSELTTPDLLLTVGLPASITLSLSLYSLIALLLNAQSTTFNDSRLLRTLGMELVFAGLIAWRLSKGHYHIARLIRGWRWKDLLLGIGLCVTTIIAVWGLNVVLYLLLGPTLIEYLRGANNGSVSLLMTVATSVLNPLAEEFYFLVIIISLWRPQSVAVAGFISATIRVGIHLYQGLPAITGIVPLAVIYTAYYVRSKRLWPVVVAHGLQDFIGLSLISLR